MPVLCNVLLTLTFPVEFKLPTFAFAVTDTEDNVPTLVILGCADAITVPAVTEFATVPVTLAPFIETNKLALPLK